MHGGSRGKSRDKEDMGKEVNKTWWRQEGWGGKWEKAEKSQVQGNKEKYLSLILISLVCGVAWQGVRQGQQDQSFKCSSVLAELCVSALCGSTKFCHPAQHGDSDKKQQSPSKPIYPASAYIPHKPAVRFSILTSSILTSLYTVVPWGMHFKTMSGMPHFLWFLGHTKTDSTPQHIRWPL